MSNPSSARKRRADITPTLSNVPASLPKAGRAKLGSLPLYRQVIDQLTDRISEGEWAPEVPIPSEFDLASEMGVSQGTVRKALDEMARNGLLVRHQGKGTFVAGYDDYRILFQFFKLTPDSGERVFPSSSIVRVETVDADRENASRLRLDASDKLIRIKRIRSLLQRPVILETIYLPEKMFQGLEKGSLPNNLYNLYASRYAIRIVRAREQLKAIALPAADAKLLGVPARTPSLLIDRTAFGSDDRPVERRVSMCLTDATHYVADLNQLGPR
jgi:GntR family transcriptional regulator